jgi:hypothetical protein
MEWFRKFFGRDDYSSDQEKFAALHQAAQGPRGMMMFAGINKQLQNMVYIRLPEPLVGIFQGYEKCEAPNESKRQAEAVQAL